MGFYKKLSLVLSLRKKVIYGSTLGILFLAVESIGFLLLIRVASSELGDRSAGEVALLLYFLAFVSVISMSLAVIISREIAGVDSHLISARRKIKNLYAILHMEASVAVISLFALLLILGLANSLNFFEIFFLDSALISFGFLLRGLGLVSAFKRVGQGEIGADKGFLLLFSIFFNALAIFFIKYFPGGLNAISRAYVISAMLTLVYEFSRVSPLSFVHAYKKIKITKLFCIQRFQTIEFRLVRSQFFSMLLIAMAGFLVTSSDVFIISAVMGSDNVSSYAIAAKLCLGVFAISSIYPSMQFQPIANNFSQGRVSLCRKYWREGMLVAFVVSASMSVLLHFSYPWIATQVLGRGILSDAQFMLLCISAILMTLTSASGWSILASVGSQIVLRPTFIDAVLTIFFGYIGATIFGLSGLLSGVILAHFISALMHFCVAYNLFIYKNEN